MALFDSTASDQEGFCCRTLFFRHRERPIELAASEQAVAQTVERRAHERIGAGAAAGSLGQAIGHRQPFHGFGAGRLGEVDEGLAHASAQFGAGDLVLLAGLGLGERILRSWIARDGRRLSPDRRRGQQHDCDERRSDGGAHTPQQIGWK